MAASFSQKAGILRKCRSSLGNNALVLKTFFAFILPSWLKIGFNEVIKQLYTE